MNAPQDYFFTLFAKALPSIGLALVIGFFLTSCGENAAVKTACNTFMKGRLALDQGDTTIIKSVTEDSLYRLLWLHESYATLLKKSGTPVMGPDLRGIYVKGVELKEDCATCNMQAESFYQLNLCKEEGKWIVKGENHNYATEEKLQKARKKLYDYTIFLEKKPTTDSVLAVLSDFFDGVETYFKYQDDGDLYGICDEMTINAIKRIRQYAVKKTGKQRILTALEKRKYVTFDVTSDPKTATCKFYGEELSVDFIRSDDNNYPFIVTGLNGMKSAEITDNIIKGNYRSLLQSIKVASKDFRLE